MFIEVYCSISENYRSLAGKFYGNGLCDIQLRHTYYSNVARVPTPVTSLFVQQLVQSNIKSPKLYILNSQ